PSDSPNIFIVLTRIGIRQRISNERRRSRSTVPRCLRDLCSRVVTDGPGGSVGSPRLQIPNSASLHPAALRLRLRLLILHPHLPQRRVDARGQLVDFGDQLGEGGGVAVGEFLGAGG